MKGNTWEKAPFGGVMENRGEIGGKSGESLTLENSGKIF